MKITKVDVMLSHVDPSMLVHFRPILCRIYTDEGIYGDGEAAIAYSAGAPAAFGMLKDLAPLIIGTSSIRRPSGPELAATSSSPA